MTLLLVSVDVKHPVYEIWDGCRLDLPLLFVVSKKLMDCVSLQFSGKRTVLQHRMVNDALAEEVKEMHGLRIFTSLPS